VGCRNDVERALECFFENKKNEALPSPLVSSTMKKKKQGLTIKDFEERKKLTSWLL